MVRRKTTNEPPPPKEWTLAELGRGIEKLKRRIVDVRALESDQVSYDDGRVDAVESEIAHTIEEVFGTDSRENREHTYVRIRKGPHRAPAFREGRAAIHAREQRAFLSGIPDTVSMLEGLIRRLEEKKDELFSSCVGEPATSLEPMLIRSIEQRFATLNELKAKGLISEEEYASRRGKILDEV